MTIREIEEQTGIRKANIRYYEEQGLLKPERNSENNYRNYSQKDVEILKKIRFLRMVGISVQDIRRLQKKEVSLSALIQKREIELKGEQIHIEELLGLCGKIRSQSIELESLNPDSLQAEIEKPNALKLARRVQKTDRSPFVPLEKMDWILTRGLQAIGTSFLLISCWFRLYWNRRIPLSLSGFLLVPAIVLLLWKWLLHRRAEKETSF